MSIIVLQELPAQAPRGPPVATGAVGHRQDRAGPVQGPQRAGRAVPPAFHCTRPITGTEFLLPVALPSGPRAPSPQVAGSCRPPTGPQWAHQAVETPGRCLWGPASSSLVISFPSSSRAALCSGSSLTASSNPISSPALFCALCLPGTSYS